MLNNLVIQVWPIEKIRPYGRALRKNQHAIDRMVAAIREFGCKIPLLVRGDGELIDGDLRLTLWYGDEWQGRVRRRRRGRSDERPAFVGFVGFPGGEGIASASPHDAWRESIIASI